LNSTEKYSPRCCQLRSLDLRPIEGIPPPPRAFHLWPYCHRKPNPADSKVFASRVALGPLFVQTLPISTNGVTCKTPFLSAVRTIRYHNSAEPKIPPQGQHSILTVAPHCIRAAYTELFDRQKLSHSQLYIRSHHHPPLGSQQPHVLQLTPPDPKLTSEFQRWYPPRDLSVESIPNRFSKILKPPHLSLGSI
jgi:hypothetical protein